MEIVKSFFGILPKKILIFLIGILISEYLVSYGLSYLINLDRKNIQKIQNSIQEKYEDYLNKIQNGNFRSIFQFLAIDYLAKNKKPFYKIFETLPKYLPKNFTIESIEIDRSANIIKLSGTLPSWIEYAKYKNYFQSKPDIFGNFNIEYLGFDKENYHVKITISFNINDIFFQ